MRIINPQHNHLLHHENASGARGRFLHDCQDHKNDIYNEVDFEHGRGSGMAAGLKPTKRFVFKDGKVRAFVRDHGKWMEVPHKRRKGRWVPPRVHVATGREVCRQKA